MRLPFVLALPFLTFGNLTNAQESPATSDVLFILDGSGSMWGRIDEVEKIVVAKDVMAGLVAELPEEIDAGLIIYGHRERGSCSDIEVIATPGETSRDDLLSSLSGITPLGKTPISDSLLRAGEVLRVTEDPVSIVLISDGIESCEGDPCATAALLREQDIDVRIHVVGFDVDEEARAQLSCIAEAGGGEYHHAGSADALSDALGDVRVSILEEPVAAPEPIVADPNIFLAEDVIEGVNVVRVETGEVLYTLNSATPDTKQPAGDYRFEFRNFISPTVTLKEGDEHIVSAADYGLATLTLADDVLSKVDIITATSIEGLSWISPSYSVTQIPPGDYRFGFSNFTSPVVTIAPNEDYLLSASNFALATVDISDDVLGKVDILDAETGERVTFVSGSSSTKQVPPGTYHLEFSNFTSPPITIDPETTYTVSAAEFALATVNIADDVRGRVNVLDAKTGDNVTFLSGSSSQKQIPPGAYRFAFSNYVSPETAIDGNATFEVSASAFGLATVRLAERVRGQFLLLQDGQDPINIRDGREKQIGPGPYTRMYDGVELGIIEIAPGETTIIGIK